MSPPPTANDAASTPATGGWPDPPSDPDRRAAGMERLADAVGAAVDGTPRSAADLGVDATTVALAREHRVGSLLAAGTSADEEGTTVPPAVERLRVARRDAAARDLQVVAELGRTVDALADRGVRAVSFKGPTLSAVAYGDLSVRDFDDLDLLVPPADVDAARETLRDLGYEPLEPADPDVEALYVRNRYAREWHHPGRDVVVDLHWRVAPDYLPVDPDVGALVDRAVDAPVGGRAVPALAPADRLPVLAVHGAKHRFHRLSWVADLAVLLAPADPDWDRALDRAGEWGCRRALLAGATLAADVFDLEAPGEVRRAAGGSPARALADRSRERLFREPPELAAIPPRVPYHLRALDRPADRGRYLWRLALSPGPADAEAARGLPAPRLVRRALRPPRLAVSLGRALLDRPRS